MLREKEAGRQNEYEVVLLEELVPQDLVEDLFGYVVVPEPPYTIDADRCMVRPLLCQF